MGTIAVPGTTPHTATAAEPSRGSGAADSKNFLRELLTRGASSISHPKHGFEGVLSRDPTKLLPGMP